MKNIKRTLSVLLSCLMLMSMLSAGVFAASGDQDAPINANEKWFGYGVDCYLLNPTLTAGDEDGLWYTFTAEAAGILQLEHSYKDVDYDVTLWVNGVEYKAYDGDIYTRPITTYPVAVGDVATINIKAKDPSVGGTVYANIKIVTGENDPDQTVKMKSEGAKVYVAAGSTVYYQDDSTAAVYATKGLIVSGDSVADVTVLSVLTTGDVAYTDSDGDGTIELKLGGSQGSAGVPAVKPSWAIQNDSAEDRCFVLTVVNDAHECVYTDDADADCNTCGEIREVPEKPGETLYGDANGDGSIDGIDAALLQQYVAGWDVTLEAAADANDDGSIDGIDAALLQQYVAGWDVILGPSKIFNDGELTFW